MPIGLYIQQMPVKSVLAFIKLNLVRKFVDVAHAFQLGEACF